MANRLFGAGLDLSFALALTAGGPAEPRLEHAVAELDEAIKDLRHLMLAMLVPTRAAAPGRPSAVHRAWPR